MSVRSKSARLATVGRAAPLPKEIARTTAAEHAVSILGDAWTILIVREAFKGARRFGTWRQNLPIPEPVLADRLRRLLGFGIMAREPACGADSAGYRLTPCGRDLWKVLIAMWKWQHDFLPGSPPGARKLRHLSCGALAGVEMRCGHCGMAVDPADTALAPAGEVLARTIDQPRYRRSVAAPRRRDAELRQPTLTAIGDQASARLLAAFFRGAHGFNELQAQLGQAPGVLSNRLAAFKRAGIIRSERHRESARRKFYRLTPRGLALFPVVVAIVEWGCRWFGPKGNGLGIVHLPCGATLMPQFHCLSCGDTLHRRDIRMES